MIRSRALLPLALVALFFNIGAQADSAWQSQPANPVILTVSGELDCCPDGSAYFDLERLDALEQTTVKTITPWSETEESFSGVRLSKLLEALGAKDSQLEAVALNDYSTKFSNDAALKYPVILATRREGKLMRVRDKGPIWIVYPLSEHAELRKEEHHSAMVWQLKSLNVGR